MTDQQDGNSVFTAQQAQQQGFSTRNVMKDDFNMEVPVESVPLPSEGKVIQWTALRTIERTLRSRQ